MKDRCDPPTFHQNFLVSLGVSCSKTQSCKMFGLSRQCLRLFAMTNTHSEASIAYLACSVKTFFVHTLSSRRSAVVKLLQLELSNVSEVTHVRH